MIPDLISPSDDGHERLPADGQITARWRTGDCNFNGVTPETEETPVTDVTTSQDQEEPELAAPMSSCCGSLPSGPAPAG